METDVDILQRMIEPHFRTHLGALAAGPLDRDEIVSRQLAMMTPEKRANLEARIADAVREAVGTGG